MFWTLFLILMILWGIGVLIFQVIRDRRRNIKGAVQLSGFVYSQESVEKSGEMASDVEGVK